MRQKYVCGFAFNLTESRVALMLKNRPEWQKGFFNGIGGKMEDGENPGSAMSREWDEETDVTQPVGGWDRFCSLFGVDYEVHFFRCNASIEDIVSMSAGETVAAFDLCNLPANCLYNLRWLIPLASNQCRADWPYLISVRGGI